MTGTGVGRFNLKACDYREFKREHPIGSEVWLFGRTKVSIMSYEDDDLSAHVEFEDGSVDLYQTEHLKDEPNA